VSSSTFEIVECAWPVWSLSRRGPQPVRRLEEQIRRCSLRESRRGIRLGRLERSCRQTSVLRSAALAARQRRDQRHTVAGETLNAAAAALSEQPSSTARTSA
jgi:hypothetical protein